MSEWTLDRERAAMERIEEAQNPGDWYFNAGPHDYEQLFADIDGSAVSVLVYSGERADKVSANWDYVLMAANTLPAAIAEIRRRRAENERLREQGGRLADALDLAMMFDVPTDCHGSCGRCVGCKARTALAAWREATK